VSFRPRLVIDTNVCLALFLYADPACAALREALSTHEMVANAVVRSEWLRVLHAGQFPFDDTQRRLAGAAYDACAVMIDPAPRPIVLPRCRDPDDQRFLELARDAGAAALLTRDRELLRLARRTMRSAGFDVLTPESWAGRL
jgi:predicted nucleic acid-binding protein